MCHQSHVWLRVWPALGLSLWLGLARSLCGQVVLNELMYHPVEEPVFTAAGLPVLDLTEDVHEFVELFNAGSNTVNLSGWRLDGGIEFTFSNGVSLAAGGYLVLAKDPVRLAALPHYGLEAAQLHGPYLGQLGNNGETIRLNNEAGQTVDGVNYAPSFPWPASADSLGISERWTGIDPLAYQYRGRSLERVSAWWRSQDPANWRASPWPGEPSPGRPNAVRRSAPLPVVVAWRLAQVSDGQPIIRSNEAAQIEVRFSATNELGPVRLEYFVDDLNRTNEVTTNVLMNGFSPVFLGTLPGLASRSIVRYRVWAERRPSEGGAYEEVVLPRSDDAFRWLAYFVTPLRNNTNDTYDLLIPSSSLAQLKLNLIDNPRTGYIPPLGTKPNGRWNLTEPAVLAHHGAVYDVHVRYNGSFHRRDLLSSYKIHFPAYHRLAGHRILLLLDKTVENAVGHRLYEEADLPTVRTRFVDLSVNNNVLARRLELEDHDDRMFERYFEEQKSLNPARPPEANGHLFKSSGFTDVGPYGAGDGRPLQTNEGWTPLQRYEWTYSSKNKDWEGFIPLQELLEQLAAARAGDLATLRSYLQANWDVDLMLTYLAIRTWMSAVDDSGHNYFLWKRANGRWTMLGWDLDGEMAPGNATFSIFAGSNVLKDSFFRAFPEEYKQRLYWLNHTLLDPSNISSLGVGLSSAIANFPAVRQTNVNQQLGFGPFLRPLRPTAIEPTAGESVISPARLRASPYEHSTNPAPAHAGTVWQIRRPDGKFRLPVYAVTSAVDLVSLPIPFGVLETGQLYFWRCIYQDANGHPSAPSEESAFRYGGSYNRINLLTLNADTIWKYEGSGTNLGSAWRGVNYDDSAWPEGPPLLGVSAATLAAPVRTPLALGYQTYYFRKNFVLQGNPNQTTLRLRHIVDDGAVFYLNGVEFLRYNLPSSAPGTMIYAAPALQEIPDPAYSPLIQVPVTNLVAGENVLAVEVHQRTTSSADVVFGLSLEATVEAESGGVRLNELLALNRSAVANGGFYPDWIELHNPTGQTQSLAGMSLTDDPLEPLKFVFPAGTTLAPRQHLIVWCDNRTGSPGWHSGFSLRAEGESVWLFRSDSNGVVELDRISFGLQVADRSVGRIPDGVGAWGLNEPTPVGTNRAQATGGEQGLRFNEWMANPVSGSDWFELFNPQLLPVELGGMSVTDDLLEPDKWVIPALSFMEGWSFREFFADNQQQDRADHAGFDLRATGEVLGLYDRSGRAIDIVEFGLQAAGLSEGRLPDGNENIVALVTASPGRSNAGDSDGDGIPDVWELAHGLNLLLADSGLDNDGDGMNNLREYIAGTEPTNRLSVLRVEQIRSAEGRTAIEFWAASNRTYTVQWKESLDAGRWAKIVDVGTQSGNRLVTVLDPYPQTEGRDYRLVTPQLPGAVGPGPVILTSPKGGRVVLSNDVSMRVFAIGAEPLSYQWRWNGTELEGETNSSLTLAKVQLAQGGLYTVVVSDRFGSDTNEPALLTVLEPPVITVQPQSQAATQGQTVSFFVTATGHEPLWYRWRRNGRSLMGQTNAMLTLMNAQMADAASYAVAIIHKTADGPVSVLSSNAVLTVTETP